MVVISAGDVFKENVEIPKNWKGLFLLFSDTHSRVPFTDEVKEVFQDSDVFVFQFFNVIENTKGKMQSEWNIIANERDAGARRLKERYLKNINSDPIKQRIEWLWDLNPREKHREVFIMESPHFEHARTGARTYAKKAVESYVNGDFEKSIGAYEECTKRMGKIGYETANYYYDILAGLYMNCVQDGKLQKRIFVQCGSAYILLRYLLEQHLEHFKCAAQGVPIDAQIVDEYCRKKKVDERLLAIGVIDFLLGYAPTTATAKYRKWADNTLMKLSLEDCRAICRMLSDFSGIKDNRGLSMKVSPQEGALHVLNWLEKNKGAEPFPIG